MGNERSAIGSGPRGRARWTRLAVLGLLMEFVAVLLMMVAAQLGGGPSDGLGFFAVVGVIPLVGAFLVWSFGSWAKFVGFLAALVPAGAMFWTAFGLMVPQSFFDFVPGALLLPGGIVAMVSCIAALVAGRRGHRDARASGGERSAIRVVAALALLLAAASAVLTFTGKSTASSASADQTIAAKNFEFDPKDVSVEGGSTVVVRNDDLFYHTLTVDELDIHVDLTPGDEVTVQIPDRAGSFVMYCEPHTSDREDPGEGDMAGTLEVG